MLREDAVELGERHPAFDGDRLILGRVVDHGIERQRPNHRVERARRVTQFEVRPAADERERLARGVQLPHRIGELGDGPRRGDVARRYAGDADHPRPASPDSAGWGA